GMLQDLPGQSLVLAARGLELPETEARIREVDFKALHVKSQDFALASLALLAGQNRVISKDMLQAALTLRFKKGKALESSLDLVERVSSADSASLEVS
ncbi:MAG: hypothetical protein K9K79_08170, partial [Desulfohalobiaceae bacterium]|nr:hypothetical protein [Desulfohalobiaceae bacterium]